MNTPKNALADLRAEATIPDRILGDSKLRQEIRGIRVGTFIDLHKVLVIPVVLAMMWYYDNWSMDAFVYLGMHGSYSLLWLIKQRTRSTCARG